MILRIVVFLALSISFTAHAEVADLPSPSKTTTVPTIDLRSNDWGQGNDFKLDGLWHAYWGHFLAPDALKQTDIEPILFPVPGVWSEQPNKKNRYQNHQFNTELTDHESSNLNAFNTKVLPALGLMTYHSKVLLPDNLDKLYLYIPDMPSAYKLFVNGELVAKNGEVGFFQNTEKPGFVPKVVQLSAETELDIVIHVSNFHYREGGIWFSLRVTDQSGYFSLAQQPIISAVFFAGILIAIGLYNFSFFAFRSGELLALNFGLLCLAVGIRRLLIDERVLYLFDWFSWASLQRIEHLSFYLALPLFMGYFTALYKRHIPQNIPKIMWLLTSPFILICLLFSNRIYTELNVAFQVLVLISISFALAMYIKVIREKGDNIKVFGISLGLLMVAIIHDVLKANGLIASNINIAHFGVLAFVIAQSIALQRTYLKSLDLVEAMSHQLKARNKELLAMDTFKDEFLATTSHELRTPLQSINGLAKILQDEAHNNFNPDQQGKISLIAKTTQRLSVLVDDILDFSAIKHGKLKLNKTQIDLSALAELTLSTVSPLLRNKNIKLTANIAEDARFVLADEFRFQQILINIVGNAVKYTEKGFIELASYTTSEHIVIEISDTGVGIPIEKRQSLFRPFEQVHVEGHLTASGTGLGLSISQQLVELHGGNLDINSQVGQGTHVTLTFPLAICSSAPEPSDETTRNLSLSPLDDPSNAANTQDDSQQVPVRLEELSDGPLIYIVDDEAVNLELLHALLSKQAYRVEKFTDGLSLLKRLNQEVPDLILLDLMMPKMSGLEVCHLVRKLYDSYELPVMMLTARHLIQDIVAALGAGANDYLIKPYHDQELIARVKSQLSVRQYWIASKENHKLKNEIKRREALEDELSELNIRLLNALDISTEMILVINAKNQIVYANELASNMLLAKFLSEKHGTLLGKSIDDFIDPKLSKLIQNTLYRRESEAIHSEVFDEESKLTWRATLKCFEQGDEPFIALILQTQQHQHTDNTQALSKLTHELNESRQKIHDIESTLKHVLDTKLADDIETPKIADSEAEDVGKATEDITLADTHQTAEQLGQLVDLEDPKEDIVNLLRTSLNLWERHTNKGKVELAEQSRCWRVYVDGTTVKTRTFDKYLSARSIPNRPRWRSVVRTANFVLAQCSLNDDEKSELKHLTEKVENRYS